MSAIFSLFSALKSQQRNLEVNTNNIANLNTNGYKADTAVFAEYFNTNLEQKVKDEILHELPLEIPIEDTNFLHPFGKGSISHTVTDSVYSNMTDGSIKVTDNPFDVAIQGDGFFSIETETGTRYTRDGQFSKNQDGYLTHQGNLVLGENGPLLVDGEYLSITEDGTVSVDGNVVDQLAVVEFENASSLRKAGKNYLMPLNAEQTPKPPEEFTIVQNALELSNVNVAESMAKLINVNRSYEAAQRALKTIDDVNGQTISIARI